MADKKRFSEDFEQWVGKLPSGVRLMMEDPTTGKEYWVSREKFFESYSGSGNGSVSGGATAYEIYAATTSDTPILSETAWIASLYGQDGQTPRIGSNGNWWIGDTDTTIRAQSTTITPTIIISGIKKGMTIEWWDPDNIPTGFVLSDGNYKNGFISINGIVIPDHRGVMSVGYDPKKPSSPTDTDGTTENYGKVGNTGGSNSHVLIQDELPPTFFYIFANSNDPGDNTLPANPLAPPVWSTNHKKGNQDYDIYAKPGVKASIGVTNTIGKGVAIPMRPKYGVFCLITKISDDDQNLEVGGQFIDPVAGTNILIDKTDATKPVFSVDMTKVLSKDEASNTFETKEDAALKMTESEFVGDGASKQVRYAEEADVAQNCDRATRDKFGNEIDTTYATIDQLNNVAGSVYRAKGNVMNYDMLPITPANGDVYNLTDTGMNYAYTGPSVDVSHPYDSTLWDSLGGVTALATLTENGLLSKEDFAILRGLSENYASKVNGVVPLDQMPVNITTGGTPTLNEEYGGGRIHKIFQPGEAGYVAGKNMVQIVANEDASTDVRWSFPSLYDSTFGIYRQQNIGTTSTAIGESKNNTDELLAVLDSNANPESTTQYAIKLARMYAGGGFTDWNLPSKADLELLSAQHRPGGSLEGFLGVTGTHGYWSSSEDGSNSFYVRLDADAGGSGDRSGLMAVRSVRIAEYGTTDGVVLKSTFKQTLDSFLSFATQSEAQTGSENTKVMTALRVVQSWYYQAENYVIAELNTTAKTLVGAINEIYSLQRTEVGEYVLSGIDEAISTGRKVSETVRLKHQITADGIYLEATTTPTDYDIIIDIKKNGASIFSTKPKITAGSLSIAGTHVLVTSPTIFNVGDIRTVTVDQIGSTETGKNLVLSLLMNKL
jgi:hypothetical protein